MKNTFIYKWFQLLYLCIALFLLLTASAQAQVAYYCNFENPDDWYEYGQGADFPTVFEFNYTAVVPQFGQGGCLRASGNNDAYTNGLLWTDLKLTSGKTYDVNAAFKHVSGEINGGIWVELDLSLEPPVEGVDYKPPAGANTDILISFNSWSGCGGQDVDGTFKADACGGTGQTLYTCPGNAGDETTVYLALKIGVGWWPATPYAFDILIDELTITAVAGGSDYTVPEFPPTLAHNKGPFPMGTEPVRDDASVDIVKPGTDGIVHEYTAYKGTPVVDGDLSDDIWKQIPWTPLEYYLDQVGRTEEFELYEDGIEPTYWFGWEDITAWFKMVWDDNNIYIATRRIDDDYSFVAGTDVSTGNIWQNDGWQIKLDTRPALEFDTVSPGAEVGFCLVDYENAAYNYWANAYNSNQALDLADGSNTSTSPSTEGKAIFGKLEEIDTGYMETFEVAFVKWPEVLEGDAEMFSICALDRDYDVQECVLQWAQGIYVKNQEHYGSVLWSPNAPPVTGVAHDTNQSPAAFSLGQNYPNPFNPTTNITYSVPQTEQVTLEVYNIMGELVSTLVNHQVQIAGAYTVTFDGQYLANGVYFYKLTTGSQVATNKMMLVK